MYRSRVVTVAATGLLLGGLLGGCALAERAGVGSGPAVDGPAVDLPGTAMPAFEPCEPSPPQQATVTAGTVLRRAQRCVFDTEAVAGDGVWLRRTDLEATTGLLALADALRLPSREPGPNVACPAIAYLPILLHLTDITGREFQPTIPHDQCGAPLPAVTEAINALSWTTVGTTRVRQLQTELEVTSGCAGSWKPEIALISGEPSAGRPFSTVDTTGRTSRVCHYEPDPSQGIDTGGPITAYVGKLVAAATLDATEAHELLTAIAQAPSAQTCSAPQPPFAVLHALDGEGPWISVEVGGCWRAFAGDGQLRQLDAEVVTRLLP